MKISKARKAQQSRAYMEGSFDSNHERGFNPIYAESPLFYTVGWMRQKIPELPVLKPSMDISSIGNRIARSKIDSE